MRKIYHGRNDALRSRLAGLERRASDGKWNAPREVKDSIREHMYKQQHGICCYCESRLIQSEFHIEHHIERHDKEHLVFDFKNLYLSCNGNKKTNNFEELVNERLARLENMSCGNKKTASLNKGEEIDYSLLLNLNKPIENLLAYTKDGRITYRKNISTRARATVEYTIERLNLNSDYLINKRRSYLLNVLKYIDSLKNKGSKTRFINRLTDIEQKLYPEYITMLIYFKEDFNEYKLNKLQ